MTLHKQPIDRPWKEYPEGTKAHAPDGGHWTKTKSGWWKWCTGAAFGTPGGDACAVTLPPNAGHEGRAGVLACPAR